MAEGALSPDTVFRVKTNDKNQLSRVDRVHNLGAWTLRVFLMIVLSFVAVLELLATLQQAAFSLVMAVPGVLAIGAVWLFRPSRKYLLVIVSATSLAMTGFLMTAATGNFVGFGEIGALLVLLAWGIQEWKVPPGPWATVLVGIAVVAIPLRYSTPDTIVATQIAISFPVAMAIGIGVYLYIIDSRRRQAMTDARNDERLEMAREIHDFVAHHVTGIVVRAQAAQFAAGNDPEASRQALAEIEQAGSEALASMRSMVAMLRSLDAESQLRPLGDVGQIPEMVSRFNSSDLSATCYLSPQLTAMVAEMEATIFRLVQESLTNVHKHARSATTVRVVVAPAENGVEVSVRDNGTGKDTKVFAKSGFGLVGLTERVESLGGELKFGPRDTGGWEVMAFIPSASS